MSDEAFARLLASIDVLKLAIVGTANLMGSEQRNALAASIEQFSVDVEKRKPEVMGAYASSVQETAASLVKGLRT